MVRLNYLYDTILNPSNYYRGFIIILLVTLLNGIVKITVVSMFTIWTMDFKGLPDTDYTPEISGGALNGMYDFFLSLYGLNAATKRDILQLQLFSISMIFITISKSTHVYLCWLHLNKFEELIRQDVVTIWEKYRYLNEAKQITDRVQQTFRCCGSFHISSWPKIPQSCCIYKTCTLKNSFRKGCFQALVGKIKYFWMRFLLYVSVPVTEGFLFIYGNLVWMYILSDDI